MRMMTAIKTMMSVEITAGSAMSSTWSEFTAQVIGNRRNQKTKCRQQQEIVPGQ